MQGNEEEEEEEEEERGGEIKKKKKNNKIMEDEKVMRILSRPCTAHKLTTPNIDFSQLLEP